MTLIILILIFIIMEQINPQPSGDLAPGEKDSRVQMSPGLETSGLNMLIGIYRTGQRTREHIYIYIYISRHTHLYYVLV